MKEIVRLLQNKIIPWTKLDGVARLVVARPVMHNADLPPGTSLSKRPLKGKRIVVKNRRRFVNQRVFSAEWPESNQQEMTLPKLVCVVSGTADYLLGNYCLHADEGTFILIPPHASHHRAGPFLDEQHLKNGDCTLLFAYAYSHGLFTWFSRSADGRHVNDKTNNHSIPNIVAVQLVNLLMQEAIADEAQSEAICKSLLFVLFTLLAREIKAERSMSPILHVNAAFQIDTDNKDFASQVREYVKANLHKPLKVENVATHMYMSSSHFSRMIRRETGVSFVEILTRSRIERAQELLRETDWTVTFIAAYVGLKSTAYFHDLFRHHAGCTPTHYRQKCHKQKQVE